MAIIAVNAASQMIALGVTLVIQMLYMIVVARFLGPEDFGMFSFCWSLIQILLIAGDLGLHNTAIREISGNLGESHELARPFLWLKLVLTLILFCGLLVFALVWNENPTVRFALVIFGVGLIFHSMSLGINILYQIHRKLYFASLSICVLFGIQLAIGVTAMFLGGHLISLGVAYLVASGIGLIINVVIFGKTIHPLGLGLPEDWKDYARRSLPVGISSVFQTTSARLAVTLLTLLVSAYETGIFSAAQRITLAAVNLPVGVMSAVLPVMASFQNERAPVRRLLRKSLVLNLVASGPLAVILYFGSDLIITVIYGEKFTDAIEGLRILCWGLIPGFAAMTLHYLYLSQNSLSRLLPRVTGFAFVVNGVLCAILIPAHGAIGAAYAVVVTELVTAVGYSIGAMDFIVGRSRP